MKTIANFVTSHSTIDALVAYYLFSNFVSALPSPNNNSNGFYKWLFAFSSSIGASLPRLFPGLRLPNDPTAGSKTYFTKPSNGDTTQGEAPKSS